MADIENVTACNYHGIATGNKVEEKCTDSGLYATKSEFVDAVCPDKKFTDIVHSLSINMILI